MRATPHETYLAERLQSAKGLGWSSDIGDGAKPVAVLPLWRALREVPQRLLDFCFRFAR